LKKKPTGEAGEKRRWFVGGGTPTLQRLM